MRVHWWSLTLMGCVGGADLGQAPFRAVGDAGEIMFSDAGATGFDAQVMMTMDATVAPSFSAQIETAMPSDQCGTCYDLTAERTGSPGTSVYRWDDGSTAATRRVCPTSAQTATVTLADATSGASASASVPLSPRASTCTADGGVVNPQILCLQNGTFSVDPLHLPSLPATFAAVPWIACSTSNPIPPTIYDDSSSLPLTNLHATDGTSYVGFLVTQELSQQPCDTLPVGMPRSFTLDLAAANSADSVSDNFSAALEVWGGNALDCSQNERLWTSPMLTANWQSLCATITPKQATDLLTLRAVSTGSLPYPGRVLVDNIKPVAACP